jgi:predicted adenylyl cyclase CyaB
MEIEAPIEYATAKAVLGLAGFRRIGQYRKQRDVYRLGRTLVVIDRLKKFGWFLEIEGEGRDIARVAAKLGLKDKDREEKSYLQMLLGWKH